MNVMKDIFRELNWNEKISFLTSFLAANLVYHEAGIFTALFIFLLWFIQVFHAVILRLINDELKEIQEGSEKK